MSNFNSTPLERAIRLADDPQGQDDGLLTLQGDRLPADREPQIESIEAPPHWDRGVASLLKQAPPHMCYHIKFGSSASKSVRINRREPHNSRALRPAPWGGARLTPKTSPSSCVLPR